jgi:CubicO group peptidase (beta-lactamase class C family)
MNKLWASLLLLITAAPATAERSHVASQVLGWAKSLGHGAVATAERRDGTWVYALAGEPLPAGAVAVVPNRIVFEIGSISKVFTGLLLADAVVEGKLRLEDTLATRLPVTFGDPAVGAITLVQLATHTSCLPRLPSNLLGAHPEDPYAGYGDEALFAYLASARLEGRPPCTADYSNLGFGILGVVLERAWGRSWASLVGEKITGPLGMPDTTQELSSDQRSRFAEPWAGSERARPWTFKAMAGAGALRSTLADLSCFADALLAGASGRLGRLWPLVSAPQAPMPALGGSIGLALLHGPLHGEDSYWHYGGTGGYRAALMVFPGSARAVVVLASNGQAPVENWLSAWLAPAGEGVRAPRVPISLPAEELDPYVGVFESGKSTRFTFVRRDGQLLARLTGQPFWPVFPSAKDEFFYVVVDAQLSFGRDAAGLVDQVTLHQGGLDRTATRVPEPPRRFEFPSVASLSEFVGQYDFGLFQPGALFTVESTTEAGLLAVTLTGQPALYVFAVGGDRFEYDVVPAAISFERDAAGKVVALVLHQNGLNLRSPRK